MYFTIPKDEPFCITYGDFNGLGNINIKHGYSAGDFAVEESLKVIRDIMPAGSFICRIAGDEFAFITPGQTASDIIPLTEQIHSVLSEKKEQIYGLSITLASADNNTFEDPISYFPNLYLAAEMDVEAQKQKSRLNQNLPPKDVLSEKCKIAFIKLLNYYRIDDTNYEQVFINALRDKISDIAKSKTEQLQSTINNAPINTPRPLKFKVNQSPLFDQDIATHIHNTLVSPVSSVAFNNKTTQQHWNTLFQNLTTHPLTGIPTQKYFDNILLPSIINGKSTDLTVHLFDIMHMKLSNDIESHQATDSNMKLIIDTVKDSFNKKNPNATLIMNGGTVLVIESTSEAAFNNNTELSSFENTAPNSISDLIECATRNQKHLNLAHCSLTCNSQDLTKAIETLKAQIIPIKSAIKRKKLRDIEEIYLALNTALSDVFDYYFTHFNPEKSLKELLLPELYNAAVFALHSNIDINLNRIPTTDSR